MRADENPKEKPLVHFYTSRRNYGAWQNDRHIKILCTNDWIAEEGTRGGIFTCADRAGNGTTVGTTITCLKCMAIYLSQQEAKIQKLRKHASQLGVQL
jgi:hypothetical protein